MFIEKILSKLIKKYHESKIAWHPRLIYRRKNKIAIREPIFLLGVQGGGLTIMSRVIRLLPEISYITGNNRFWAGADELHNSARFKYLPDQLTLRSPGYYNLLGHEKNHIDFGYERAFLYASNEFINEYRLSEKDWTPELENALKNAIQICLCVYANNINSAQFHDMSQSYILKIPFLERCFPDAKFIIATRDPYAVCWKQAQVSPIFKTDSKRAVQYAAEHWFNSYHYAIQDTQNKNNALWIRFEDFMKNPIDVLKTIFSFLGKSHIDIESLISQYPFVPLGSSDPEKWFPINEQVNKRHYHSIPDWARNIITYQCGELIQRFSY